MAKEVSKTCRTCLGSNRELLSIYNGDNKTVVEMLEYILDTQLDVTEELPQKVCLECFNDIGRCYSFKTKCKKSLKILKNQLDRRKIVPQGLQIKKEPGTNISEDYIVAEKEPHAIGDTSRPVISTLDLASIKSEPTVSQNEITSQTQMQSFEQVMFPSSTIASSSNCRVESDHYGQNNFNDVHTVQYLIRELKEDRDSVEQVLEVNIRHCALCRVGFAKKSDFNSHMQKCRQDHGVKVTERKRKPRVKKHICPICAKAFPRPCRLNNHINKHHGPSSNAKQKQMPKKYTCPHCNSGFNLESFFKHHLKSHIVKKQSNQFRNKCKLCQKPFIHERELKTHSILEHNDEKPFKCKFCTTGFTRKFNLYQHELKCMTSKDVSILI